MRRTLYWLDRDLRLDDNNALLTAMDSDCLDLVYCLDPGQFHPGRYNLAPMGANRAQFLHQGLADLNDSLQALGQQLHLLRGPTVTVLAERIQRLRIDRLVCSRSFGWEERHRLAMLRRQFPLLVIDEVDTYTLFTVDSLPFPLERWPETYSKFRRRAEEVSPQPPLAAPAKLPPPILVDNVAQQGWQHLEQRAMTAKPAIVRGGERAAEAQVKRYLADDLPLDYKAVRNALDGWDNSSKLSFWLSQGSLSVRRARQQLALFESTHGGNESTHWLYVELLWREYFQWLASTLGTTLFAPRGNRPGRPINPFYPERFQKWCHGNTPFPLVNACMNDLRATGYLSNRGRQIAASCLVNELSLDWRYGAAWFEQQLLDYDVATNWGNWQYIAGVGADPRGGRHFNLSKQAEQFDPDGRYTRTWSPENTTLPLDSVGIDDWPLGG